MVIDHFDKFPLKTKKSKDYNLFKKAFFSIKNKEHLTKQGLEYLVKIKSSMNYGLSNELKLAFPDIKICPVKTFANNISVKPIIEVFEPNWVSGFASGDGSFQVEIRKIKKLASVAVAGIDHKENKYQVLLTFSRFARST